MTCCQFAPTPIEKASLTLNATVGLTFKASTFDFVAWKRPIQGASCQLVSSPNGTLKPAPIQTRSPTWPDRYAFGTGIHLPAFPPSLPRGTGNGAPPAEGTVDATLVKSALTPIGSTDATRFQPLTRVRAAGLK